MEVCVRVRWKEDVQTVMHSWRHVHLMRLCMLSLMLCVCLYVMLSDSKHFVFCSFQKCTCASTSLCMLVYASVRLFVSLYLNLHIVECCVIDRSCHKVIWEFEEKQQNCFTQESCVPHTRTLKWNAYFNYIYKPDYQHVSWFACM